MLNQKTMVVCLVLALLGTVCAGAAFSQQRGARGDRRGGRERPQFDREQMRERMAQRHRKMLGATEEEWKVLGPRLEKVMELSRQTRGGGIRAMFRRRPGRPRGRRGGQDPAQSQRDLSPVQEAGQDLQQALQAEEVDAAEIKEKLTALREAREKAREELDEAREELREVVTVEQEARLVLMGLLD